MNLIARYYQRIKSQPPMRYASVIILIILLVLFLSFQLKFKSHLKTSARPKPVILSAPVVSQDIPIYFEGLGSVVPLNTIIVRTQIDGQLLAVYFKEGQWVEKGEQIAQIDPRPYQAQLTQYQGQLARDNALLSNASIDLKRYQTLWKQNSISQQVLATQTALVEQYQGAIKTDQGLIASSQLNLLYCRIISPVNGRIGLRLVDAGNYIKTADTQGLATITTLNPITVVFTLAQDYIPKILPFVNQAKPLMVKAYDRQHIYQLAQGVLLAIDNQIDPTTGTVKFKAQFNNADNKLFPNQFVNIRLFTQTLTHATVIPIQALQYSTQGDFVYVVNRNHIVSIRPIKHGDTTGQTVIVNQGLTVGERVVIDGIDQLSDGMTVTETKSRAPAAYQKMTS